MQIVHFRSLHSLLTGAVSGIFAATSMGHTYDRDICVGDFPAIFPKLSSPISTENGSTNTGVSSFGFGGSMAHVIVDGKFTTTTRSQENTFKYRNESDINKSRLIFI